MRANWRFSRKLPAWEPPWKDLCGVSLSAECREVMYSRGSLIFFSGYWEPRAGWGKLNDRFAARQNLDRGIHHAARAIADVRAWTRVRGDLFYSRRAGAYLRSGGVRYV